MQTMSLSITCIVHVQLNVKRSNTVSCFCLQKSNLYTSASIQENQVISW